jgi:hypothetical protein
MNIATEDRFLYIVNRIITICKETVCLNKALYELLSQ